jgi:hypothetical protein
LTTHRSAGGWALCLNEGWATSLFGTTRQEGEKDPRTFATGRRCRWPVQWAFLWWCAPAMCAAVSGGVMRMVSCVLGQPLPWAVYEPEPEPVNPHFDGIWKDALTRWFPECLLLFWPQVHEQINWAVAPVFLDKELQSLRRITKRDTQFVDQLAQVQLRDGATALLLIHLEVQAGSVGRELPWRMLRYSVRLLEKHPKHKHFSCAILLDRAEGPMAEVFDANMISSQLRFTFPVVNLASWAQRTEELHILAASNPFAVVVLAQLACRATRPDKTRLVTKLELAKLLKLWGYGSEQRVNLLRTIDSMLLLPQELDDSYFETLTQIEDEQTMHFISSIERIYWNRKMAEREQGWEKQGVSSVLRAQLKQKFGALPDWAETRLNEADTATLNQWAINVLQADTLEAVFTV